MKTTTIIAALALFVTAGCAVDTDETDIDLGTADQAVCTNPEGVYAMEAALATAVAKEIGRWDGTKDFTCSSGKLALTAEGRAACTARCGCANIDAILSMQNETYFTNELGWVWNGPAFGSRMCTQLSRLQESVNAGRCKVVGHSLSFDHQETGVCALDFWYKVGAAGAGTYSCGAPPPACVDAPPPNGGTCAQAVAYGWCGQTWMNGTCAASCGLCTPPPAPPPATVDVNALKCQMELYDDTANPWLNFQSTDNQVGIDPADGTVSDDSTPTLACWDAANGYVYDPPKTKVGQCCVVAGYTKKLYAYSATLDKCR